MKRVLLFFIFLISLNTSVLAENENTAAFEAGNEAYVSDDFEEALQHYTQALSSGQTASLHYNLGNTYFKLNEPGSAILHYKKALALDPTNPDFQANLRFVKSTLGLPSTKHSFTGNIAKHLSLNGWTILAAITLWATILTFTLPVLFLVPKPGYIRGLGFLTLSLFMISSLCLYSLRNSTSQGIILTQDSPLKVSPTQESEVRAYLPAGITATAEKEYTGHLFISADGKQGWVSRLNFGYIWDQS